MSKITSLESYRSSLQDENIIIDLVTGDTKLIDFGAATVLKKSHYADFQGESALRIAVKTRTNASNLEMVLMVKEISK